MADLSLESIIEAIPSQIKENRNPVHYKTKDRGSVLDQFRSEILALHNNHQCSYGEIQFWLKEKHHICISRTAIYNRINYWKRLGING